MNVFLMHERKNFYLYDLSFSDNSYKSAHKILSTVFNIFN